jgi:hypothetical protein
VEGAVHSVTDEGRSAAPSKEKPMSDLLLHYALSRHTDAGFTDPHLHHRYDLERERAATERDVDRRPRWRDRGRRAFLSLARAT